MTSPGSGWAPTPRSEPTSPRALALAELSIWYLALLGPTLLLKYLYLDAAYVGGLSTAVEAVAPGQSGLALWPHGAAFFTRDLFETGLATVILFVLGRPFTSFGRKVLIATVLLGVILTGGVNYVAYSQLGTMLTRDTLGLAWQWAWTDPSVMRHLVTPRRLVALGAALLYVGAPVVLTRLARGRPAGRWPWIALAGASGAMGVLGTAIGPSVRAPETAPRRGFWSQSILTFMGSEETSPLAYPALSRDELIRALEKVAYPRGTGPPATLVEIPDGMRRPRHVIVVSLETAARKYYPLGDRPGLPTLRRMRGAALVSDHHYSTAPSTASAVYSMVTGTYPRPGALPIRYGPFEPDGLPRVLAAHGFEPTYVDSYVTDWAGLGEDRLLRSLGFSRLLDSRGDRHLAPGSVYEQGVAREARSFAKALDAVDAAASRNRKAFVFLTTVLGHYRWRVAPGLEEAPPREQLLGIVRAFDGLLGQFLSALEQRGLGRDVIIVLTGDHGPRFKEEATSLGERFPQTELTFNVPFLLYAPGLLPREIRIPYPTSHVDIAPTLLDLLGLPRDALLYHGDSMLDARLSDRVVFLTSAGLFPVERLAWRGRVLMLNDLSGQVSGDPTGPPADAATPAPAGSLSPEEARRIFTESQELFEETVAYFLRRAAGA